MLIATEGYETIKSHDLPAFVKCGWGLIEICEHSGKGKWVTKIKQLLIGWEAGSKFWSIYDKVIIECHQCNFSRENLL